MITGSQMYWCLGLCSSLCTTVQCLFMIERFKQKRKKLFNLFMQENTKTVNFNLN